MRSLFKSALENNGNVIVTIDGDGQFLPEEIPKFMEPILKNQSDIVIGYRFDDKTEMPTYRKIGNKVLDKISNFASDLPFRDTQSGFRAYSKKAVQMIKFTADGFGADSEILIDASKKDLRISEEKVTVIYNTGGQTSTKHPIIHSSSVISTLIELIAIRQPLRYLGIPGIILLVIGIIYSIAVIVIFNDTRYFSIHSTLIALGSITIGIVLLLMSVVLFSINRVLKRES
jgi:glycosyltransferase involved in cell wall biosynthesis